MKKLKRKLGANNPPVVGSLTLSKVVTETQDSLRSEDDDLSKSWMNDDSFPQMFTAPEHLRDILNNTTGANIINLFTAVTYESSL